MTLTQEQIAQCARIVTGEGDWFYSELNQSVKRRVTENYWNPNFNGDRFDRSQALAIVTWLFDKTDPMPNAAAMRDRIGRLVHLRNTAALMALVLELSEGKS